VTLAVLAWCVWFQVDGLAEDVITEILIGFGVFKL
jgi:hypothetical protein